MRITVGHVLLVGAVGTFVYLKGLPSEAVVMEKLGSLEKEFHSLKGLFMSGEAETRGEPVKTQAKPEPVKEEPAKPVASAPIQPKPQEKTVVQKKKTKPAKKVAKKKTKTKKFKSKKVRKVAKKKVKKKPVKKIKKAKKKGQVDRLMGTYVSLELTTGRVVKGVLQGKSAQEYTIQLPGMGPFKYPVKNVKTIKAAE